MNNIQQHHKSTNKIYFLIFHLIFNIYFQFKIKLIQIRISDFLDSLALNGCLYSNGLLHLQVSTFSLIIAPNQPLIRIKKPAIQEPKIFQPRLAYIKKNVFILGFDTMNQYQGLELEKLNPDPNPYFAIPNIDFQCLTSCQHQLFDFNCHGNFQLNFIIIILSK